MTYIIRNSDGAIKSYLDFIHDTQLDPGETYEFSTLTMDQFSDRFSLSYQGKTCCTVTAKVNDPAVEILVSAPGKESVSVDVNGDPQIITLEDGYGIITLPTTAPGTFLLAPTDRKTYAAAGCGLLAVVVE